MFEVGRENGVRFVTGKPNTYFVIYEDRSGDEDEYIPVVKTAREIFDCMDMSDCHGREIERIFLIKGKDIIECRFRGTWFDPSDPLKMQIEDRETEEIYDIGYGTDH